MTTTPDSRIAHDYGARLASDEMGTRRPGDVRLHDPLGYYAKRGQETPIDTSTTAGKIRVMEAYERGEAVQARPRSSDDWWEPHTKAEETSGDKLFSWDWNRRDYRIAPPPAPALTALQAARDRAAMVPPTGGDADNSVRDLLKQIDDSHIVSVTIDDAAIVQFFRPNMPKGRYRLLRDEE